MGTRRAWRMLALFASGLVGFAAGSRVRAAEPTDEVVEAEMLKDLDLLSETDMPQPGEFFRRMRVLEYLRLLESLRVLEGSAPSEPATKEGQ